ncbi:MAG: hypothetical protein PVG35_14860 [Desulfobacterales bacterium]|jgi:hypothetical protein
MEPSFLIVTLTGVIGALSFFLWQIPRKRRRLQHLSQQGGRHGFTVAADTDMPPKEKFAPLRLFCLGRPGRMENVLTRGNPAMWIFDYDYRVSSHQTVRQTVAVFKTDGTKWPHWIIESRKRERLTVAFMRILTQKVANWQLRFKEVDVSFHPGFYQHYKVLCQDNRENLKDLMPQSLLDRLCQHPGRYIEAMDRWVLICRQGKTVKPNDFETFLHEVMDIYKHLAP